ncbi:hypothetical protein [Sulfobacillus harzensis]|uniref:Uncharacterized protein n=1 Tax=Sulfobacillus harzensis TaxID=2729629 RepID=A0A7Y0L6G6_9FIRM|nr:hypothetical protein [Sulfobacillus harzensis]NMP23812.1 hypothetical protein [Sulfobacillus harzensis]
MTFDEARMAVRRGNTVEKLWPDGTVTQLCQVAGHISTRSGRREALTGWDDLVLIPWDWLDSTGWDVVVPEVLRPTLAQLALFLAETRNMGPRLQAEHLVQHWPGVVQED